MTAPRDPEEVYGEGRARRRLPCPMCDPHGRRASTVADLDRSLAYYARVGLRGARPGDGRASLGAGGEDCSSRRGAGRASRRSAYRPLPLRAAGSRARATSRAGSPTPRASRCRSRALRSLRQRGDLPLRPRPARHRDLLGPAARAWEGQVAAADDDLPLDVETCSASSPTRATEPFDGLAAGTSWATCTSGSRTIAATVAFYRDGSASALMAAFGSQAAFLSAGGYHHHVGANTWESRGASPAPPGDATLEQRRSCYRPPPTRARRAAAAAAGPSRRPARTACSFATRRGTCCWRPGRRPEPPVRARRRPRRTAAGRS